MKAILFALLSCFIVITSQAQITSTFDTNADGWIFSNNGTPVTVNHNAINGNPGGFVATVPYPASTINSAFGWLAPAKFLGPHALRSYGMNLRFDLQQAFAGTFSASQGDVRIGVPGFYIVFSLPVKPAVAPAWSSYTIKLDETSGWRVTGTTGALATQADIIRVLTNIATLEIRGTYITNAANVVGIDNVILEQKILDVAPAVTSFSPLSGIPGASVTINGSNFGATTAQNAVYFGTTKATITGVTASRIDATIPPGAQFGPITVTNLTTGLTTRSTQSFSPSFDNNKDFGGRIIPSSLDLKDDINLPAGSGGITGLDLGDLDGDGLVDIIATEIKSSPIAYQELLVFRNLGVTGDINASSFAAKIVLGQGANDCMVVDLDGDGKLDIVGHYSAAFVNYFITYRNISTPGTIAFEAPESFVDAGNIGDLHAADLDGDGRPDLMGTHPSVGLFSYFYISQNLSVPGDILLGAVVAPHPIITSSREISTGDLTGDGKLDIVVSNGGAFRIFHNQSTPGTIVLAAPVLIDPTNNVTNVEIADLDNDGKLDLSWASGVAASAIRIQKNNYSGGVLDESSFEPEVVITSPAYAPDRLTVADINGDGKLDMVTAGGRDIAILENISTGTLNSSSFAAPVLFQGTGFITNMVRPVIADLDGDNKPDVVTATTGSSSNLQIFVFRNTSFPAPVINSVTPIAGEAGISITLSGSFMNTALENPNVKVGLTPTTTSAVSNTSVSFPIPAGSKSERVSVNLHGLTGYSKPLTVTFPTSRTINASSFTSPIEFALTNAFVDFTVGADNLSDADFDNDGKTDVVVNDNNTFRIFRNTVVSNGDAISTSSLTSIATTYTGSAHLTTSDIDGDGKVDLFANGFIHRNNSGTTADAISFEPAVQHIVSGTTGIVANHDFNHDGKSDIAHTGGNLYQVDENASRKGAFTFVGGGVFSTIVNSSISAAAGGQPEKIIADDFDGDGYDDIAFGVNAGADFLSVVRNTGLNQPLAPAQFEAALTFPALDLPWSIASADFDGDGKTDIVLGNNNAAFISIYKNTSTVGSISFLDKQDIAALTRANEVKTVDLDGDGKAEIVVAHKPTSTTGSFTIFQNTSTPGAISFSAGINYPLTRAPLSLAIADINLDAKPDLIFTTNGTTDALMIFENKISAVTIMVSQQPTASAVCNGATTSFTTTATGTTNIAYQWQFSTTLAGTYTDINNGGGYSNVNTALLSVNTTSNFGAGFYRCRITGDLAAAVFSNAVELTINAIPAAPTVTNGARCGAGSVTLSASGGVDGQYRWYTAATGGTAISGEVNSIYVTPSLTTTTPYFVSINNGCESPRTAVTATINSLPAIPVITSNITLIANAVTICSTTTLTLSAPNGFSSYSWSTGATTSQINVPTSGNYSVAVTDASGCSSPVSDVVTVTVVPAPCNNSAPVINTTTSSTTIGGQTTINLLDLISDADNNLVTSSLIVFQQPGSGAVATIANGILTINYSGISFTGKDQLTIQVCDVFTECTQQILEIDVIGEIEIYNGISPNDDDLNPIFLIRYIDLIPETLNNKVTIFNRWGSKVFEVEDYDNTTNVFRGLSDNGNELPSGTYFYKIQFFDDPGRKPETGYLTLKR